MSGRARLRRLEESIVAIAIDTETDQLDLALHEFFCEQLRLRGVEPTMAEDGLVAFSDEDDDEIIAWLLIGRALQDGELEYPDGVRPENFWCPHAPRSS